MKISSLKYHLSVIWKQKTVLPCVNFMRGERGYGPWDLFLYKAERKLTLGLLPPRRHVVWRDSVGDESSGSELKSECADMRIFCTRAFWLLRHTDEPQRGRNSCLWLQSRSVLSSFGVVLMSCRVNIIAVFCLQNLICLLFIFADQVFIDPTFSGIFVCGPLQSFVAWSQVSWKRARAIDF